MPNFSNQTDFVLWKAFKKGDKNALDVIFIRHYPLLYNYGLKLTGQADLTADCLQDFFLYLYEHRQNLKDLDAIKPYLLKAFRNRLIHYLKIKNQIVSLEEIEKEGLPLAFSIEEIMIEQENKLFQQAQLFQQINQLTNKQKELIYLKYYSNLSITEIAEVVDISYQGVLNGLGKILKKLRSVVRVPMIAFFAMLFF